MLLELLAREGIGQITLRALHVSGATYVLLAILCHLSRTIRVGIQQRASCSSWLSGFQLIMLFFFAAFSGYCIPVSLMAYWALVVITNLVSSIPVIGSEILSSI